MKTAFITGAATGIGEGLTNKLAAEGWRVYAGYHRAPPEKSSWASHPNVVAIQCDVTQPSSITNAANAVRESNGNRLDLLINNAAYSGSCGVVEAPIIDEYRKTFEANFWGPLQMVQAFMPLLRNARGRIINTTSASVWMTIPMGSAYPVSKSALKTLTAHLRMEMAPFGVEVTALEPGGVTTPMTTLDTNVSAAQWNAIPDNLRTEYQLHFVDSASAIGNNFKLYSPEAFADRVYHRIILAKRLRPTYLIGPGVAPLPWLHRLLPEQWVQAIWQRMFKRS